MAFCGNCGNQMNEGVKFCPSCGAMTGASPAQQPAQAAAPSTPAYTPPIAPGAPPQADTQDAQDNKAMGILAYIIFLIPLLAAPKESKFARYHTNQGLVLFIAAVIWGVAYGVISSVLYAISWRLGLAVSGILSLTGLVFLILCIIGIINVVNGRMKPLPVIGGITLLK